MNPPIKKRKDCFFGLHSDFHAVPEEGLVIGATLRESDVREICERLRPDFVQIDCKGHPGWASYPTRFSNAMPRFKTDPLRLWRDVTREYGIALYCHFSGVYDEKYCREHPEDAVRNADGTYADAVLPFGKYYDEYFIPQISELVEVYGIDGVWIDGDCWYVKPDYRPETIREFEEKSGIDLHGEAPVKRGDPHYFEYLEFTRERFRRSLRHYVDRLHEKYPELQICSNWAFSDHMPERVGADVDFLSGDLNPADCFNSARYAGRMLAGQGLPWDLMSWNFRNRVYGALLYPAKHPLQLMQEAASVIALGGAYQDNVSQFPDGTHNLKQIRDILPLAAFLRERQPYCFGGKPIHQAAMLVSTYDRYREMDGAFDRKGMEKFVGLTALLCDCGQSLELVGEHTLKGRYDQYPLLIVPELSEGLEEKTLDDLKRYVSEGGSLLLVGTKTCRLFAENGFGFGTEKYGEAAEVPNFAKCFIGHEVSEASLKDFCYFSVGEEVLGSTVGALRVKADDANAKIYGRLHNSAHAEGVPFAVGFGYGKGKIAAIGADLGTQYYRGTQYQHAKLIRRIADDLYDPLVRIESANGKTELVCLEKDGDLLIQLVNANGGHSDARCVTEDAIPPVVDIALSLKAERLPKQLFLQPSGTPIAYRRKDGRIYFDLDRVDIHSVVQVVY